MSLQETVGRHTGQLEGVMGDVSEMKEDISQIKKYGFGLLIANLGVTSFTAIPGAVEAAASSFHSTIAVLFIHMIQSFL